MPHDPLHGAVTVSFNRENGVLDVYGPAIPRVRITRDWQARRDKGVPIGTRVAKELTIHVDEDIATLLPSLAGLTRRSHAVDVQCRDAAYQLLPKSCLRSRLTRNGQRIGRFRTQLNGRAKAQWVPEADVHPLDVSIGYALAVAFGTGRSPVWLEAIGETLNAAS